ncbi:hypothetical protein [Nostoc sp. UHCC 0926]|uniref:hypothetical protein n=1 Tax=Nostoc sp. UHCC 0926 TaxID=3025190 RepID=UPI00235E9DA8|nr:hypothetical protein [Nostoc sp. UHCC 0926]
MGFSFSLWRRCVGVARRRHRLKKSALITTHADSPRKSDVYDRLHLRSICWLMSVRLRFARRRHRLIFQVRSPFLIARVKQ